jgi:hypothetical protein
VNLCDTCVPPKLIKNTRASTFSMCMRSKVEPQRFPKYPRLPVLSCPGYEPETRATDPSRAR